MIFDREPCFLVVVYFAKYLVAIALDIFDIPHPQTPSLAELIPAPFL